MWAAQKKNLPFAQISTAENVQYANCFTVLSFCDYIIIHSMYQKNVNQIAVRVNSTNKIYAEDIHCRSSHLFIFLVPLMIIWTGNTLPPFPVKRGYYQVLF